MRNSPNMELKKINRNRIFRYIHQREAASKAEISYELHISLPTITQNIAELMGQNLIVESGSYESTGGRRAKMISCNSMAKVALGFDITRNHISAVVVDLKGNVVSSIRELYRYGDYEDAIEKICDMAEHIVRSYGIDEKTVLGVGVSLPAIIDVDMQTINTALVLPFPRDFHQHLRSRIRFPCLFYNDANCGGFAELWSRKPTENDVFYFSLSGTVGGAAMIGDQIYTGMSFAGGEVGHLIMVPNGKQCYCGQKGCVDCYCNSDNLAELTDGNLSAFFERIDQDDSAAKARMDEYLDYLAIAIHNVKMLLDCDIVLGGYVGSYSELFLDDLKQRLLQMDIFHRTPDYLMACHHHTEAAAVGAALMYISRFIENV